MGNKMVTVTMTILLLSMCVVAGIALSTLMEKKDINANDDIHNVIGIQNEISERNTVIMSGAELISAMIGTYDIDNNIPNTKEKVYTNNDSSELYKYTIAIDEIQPEKNYKVIYTDNGADIKDFTNIKRIVVRVELV